MKIELKPDKLYYSIGEVADLFGVTNSLIRYWESEFVQLNPGKNRKGDRKFTEKDIRTLEVIYALVKVEGYTIEGARRKLKEELTLKKRRERIILRLENIKKALQELKLRLE